ncbi:hypothetical protein GGX14DRAFT_540327 [Mycena pura]|uniref:F-box domain-containing protein n=1 Tax=Mycena pura TaxID=153505 RepID=A0AAD6VT68_9AGAR|nr:hypothetical protein GGX14DRAFT_540327 [Mycena pura]
MDQKLANSVPRRRDHEGHPIGSLPVELIASIFVHCLPLHKNQFGPLTAPLLLTRICGTWRAIALRTPELWSCIAFKLFHVTCLTANVRMLDCWLERSAAHPLTLSLHACPPIDAAVPLISAQSARWKDVDLFFHPTTFAAFPNAALLLPQLRRLSLGCSPLRAGASPPSPITAFRNAPQLVEVSLIKLGPSSADLPWAQLTTFFCQCANLQDALSVLHLAPILLHLSIHLDCPLHVNSALPVPDFSPCLHPCLTSLTIKAHPAAPLPLHAVLGSLTLPALRSLAIPALLAEDTAPFAAFAARAPGLAELVLALAPLPRGALCAALAPLRALARLELTRAGTLPLCELLGALAADARGASAFLPQLSALHVDQLREAVPYAPLLAALEARGGRAAAEANKAPARLGSITIKAMHMAATRVPDPEYLARLETLKAQGLVISVSYL